jgi:hypothetical protein
MQITKDKKGALVINASSYSLVCAADRPYVNLLDVSGNTSAELFVLSSVHSLGARDDTVAIGNWEITETPEKVVLSIQAKSSVWKNKTYRFHCYPDRLAYDIEVEGTGDLTDVLYFGGYYSGQVRWGSGFFWSGQKFKAGFNPESTVAENYRFTASEGSIIDSFGVPLPGKSGWFFTPPPFCFAFEIGDGWVSMGVEAQPGENRFGDYQYRGQQGAFCLSLSYEGYTRVDGKYTLPTIGFDFADDEYDALEKHVNSLRRQEFVPTKVKGDEPSWWYEPIYCGWGSQCFLASKEKGHAPDYARQELYDGFLKSLEDHGVSPTIVVLDDKWQATYGENRVDERKWHDLKGFIAYQHSIGRKVLLWLKAWDPEGIPVEECIVNSAGLANAVDPTNPAFEHRFRESIRHMLSPEGYNADGFKIDFTARIPCSPGLKMCENVWGLELMKRYLGIIHSEAKKVKPDSLIMAHTPHPYLADVVDMIRLNDINIDKDVNRAMKHRARVAHIACPDAIIDTDNWPITNKAVWRKYMNLQTQIGVPSLYYATHIDSTGEALTDEDYALIRDSWAAYRKSRRELNERLKPASGDQ